MRAICSSFGLAFEQPASVEKADRVLLMTEKRDLLGPEPLPWTHTDEPLPNRIHPWSWQLAECQFINRFQDLTKQP
jgi:hypothetical protein